MLRSTVAQVVVEQAFGRLKGRWRILLDLWVKDHEMATVYIVACCMLHNMCQTESACEEDVDRLLLPPEAAVPMNAHVAPPATSEGETRRLNIRRSLAVERR